MERSSTDRSSGRSPREDGETASAPDGAEPGGVVESFASAFCRAHTYDTWWNERANHGRRFPGDSSTTTSEASEARSEPRNSERGEGFRGGLSSSIAIA
ncbi:hypothetical protein DV733_12595 [Halapricum salinum]|uniref:Uncharacterized protein n=1 Tax=Halapricum salinum TaxID=1457250 RepID=A0A4D6HDF8_9EURY|nr:hypothetical protein DV733_12595 [Halapricum salinum]